MGSGGGGGGGGSRFPGVIEGFLGVEIFDSGIFWVSISFTWGFFAFSKQSEVGILMLLMKQKKFSGVSGVSFLGGWGLIFVPIRSFCHLKSGVTPPPVPENWVPKKELLHLQ